MRYFSKNFGLGWIINIFLIIFVLFLQTELKEKERLFENCIDVKMQF